MSNNLSSNRSKNILYIVVIVLVIASIVFRLINEYKLEQTSILFIGLPAFMSFLLIKYVKTPKSLYGIVFKVITLFLLLSSILLGEGIVCVIFMAPIFYAVGAIVVFIVNLFRNRNKFLSLLIVPILLLISQPNEIIEPPKLEVVKTNVVVNKTVAIDAFNKTPNFKKDYPNFFKIGFPEPIGIRGKGVAIGDKRKIKFKSQTKGIGTLELEVVEKTDTSITFRPIQDDTHIDHWLTWQEMYVEFNHLDNENTEIQWITKYNCDLGPGWYFKPLEKYAVDVMNQHLINVYFE